ncbi:MAG: Sec-independent protein translocase protein TatB [Alphaproteobacteria bacterium MarineAlpha4_Bin2]|nr:MAG: Sec-independent protein translocase protein TatB [Alphaproteobacteria bacterium MarineAlpha4_Bin2]
MFDIGWQELFLVALITILVVGPKELPRVLRAALAVVRKMRGLADDFHRGIDELAREADLDEIRKDLEKSVDLNIEKSIDPDGVMSNSIREIEADLKSTGIEIETDVVESNRGSLELEGKSTGKS